MSSNPNIVFLFPGQGAQYPGMAKDFFEQYATARYVFEEADDLLGDKLSSIILHGPEDKLVQTKNSQLAIYVASLAMLRVVQEIFPDLKPTICAGLSLGEYTALTAGNYLTFQDGIALVQRRGAYMNEACETTKGTMAVVLGLSVEEVEDLVREVNLPHDLWVANFNCPGQIVLSGTLKGIEKGSAAAKQRGAKRVLPLQVHGAFHSGLMQLAEERLSPFIQQTPFSASAQKLVMNVPGSFVVDIDHIKTNLIRQVTHSVRWEQGIHAIEGHPVRLYIECGPGKTLAGMNKKIGVQAPTLNIEKIEDLDVLAKFDFRHL